MMEQNRDLKGSIFVQFRETEALVLLSLILIVSIFLRANQISNSNPHINLTDFDQSTSFNKDIISQNNILNNPNITIDTTSHLDIMSNTETDFSKSWMRRYSSGVRFEFHPPN